MEDQLGTVNQLEIFPIVMGLLGGLAFFLFGLEQMTDALKIVAGSRMKGLLARLTTNRFKSLFAGAFVTSIIQSSSVTTVLVVGFITAGLMSLSQSIGIILGANIGTTVTAQIVAFKVTQYALLLVAVGFSLSFLSKSKRIRRYGHLIMGLGMVFFGMQLMSDGTHPLRSYEPFIALMQRMDNPAIGILVSALFTGLVQSSSATLGVVIVLASQGFISLEAGIALALGANVGTCVTAILASIGKPPEAVRAGMVHIVFNVLGVLIWVGFIDELVVLVKAMSPSFTSLEAGARLAAETPRQVANAHTVFNIANALIFIWFTGPLAALVTRLVPDRPQKDTGIKPKFLDPIVLQTPDLALQRVRLELERLGSIAVSMLAKARTAVPQGNEDDLSDLRRMDDDLDTLHGAVVTYLGKLSQEEISDAQSEALHDCIAAANYIENIGDVIETNLVEAGLERTVSNLEVSHETLSILSALHDRVAGTVEVSLTALARNDHALAQRVIDDKGEINGIVRLAEEHLGRRLVADDPNRLVAFRIEKDIIENLKRIYYFSKRIAKLVVETDMEYLAEKPEPQELVGV